MNYFSFKIADFPLVYSSISNQNIFLSAVIHCLTYSIIRIMNIISIFKCRELSNSWNRFVDFFIKDNAVGALTNSMIFKICNYLNNVISKCFNQSKFFSYPSNSIHQRVYFALNIFILLKDIRCQWLLLYISNFGPCIKFIASKLSF